MNVKKSIKSGMIKEITKSKKLSLIASGLILSSSLAFGADTIDAAFKDGKVSGSLIGYGVTQDNKTGDDSGFTSPDFITFEKEHKTISNKPHG